MRPPQSFSTQVVPATLKLLNTAMSGYVTPQIQFEVQLLTQNWNRRYLQVGLVDIAAV